MAYSSKKTEPIIAGRSWHDSGNRKLADHIFMHTKEAKRAGSKAKNPQSPSLLMHFLQQDCTF